MIEGVYIKIKDLTGEKFGRLTVLYRTKDHYYPNGRHDVQYLCKCDCGNEVVVLGIHLRSGHTLSCGCLRSDKTRNKMTKHGKTDTRIHCIWKNMKARCLNQNRKDYKLYGGRGITICDSWNSFENFYNWAISNGYKENLTLDRIDVNKGYSPDNCRWATQKEQCNNTRKNINVFMDGEQHTLKEWAEIKGLKYGSVSSRVNRGWDPVKALKTPMRTITEHN